MIEEDQWAHVVIRFHTIPKESSEKEMLAFMPFFKGGALDEPQTSLFARWIKLEKGLVPTDYTAAPETVRDLVARTNRAETIINGTEIIDRVMSSEKYQSDQEIMKESLAQTRLDLNGFRIDFENTKDMAEGAADQVGKLEGNVRAWFDFSLESELKIGRSDSPFSVSLSNEELAFRYYTTKVAYVRGDKFFNPNGVIADSLRLGDLTGTWEDAGVTWS